MFCVISALSNDGFLWCPKYAHSRVLVLMSPNAVSFCRSLASTHFSCQYVISFLIFALHVCDCLFWVFCCIDCERCFVVLFRNLLFSVISVLSFCLMLWRRIRNKLFVVVRAVRVWAIRFSSLRLRVVLISVGFLSANDWCWSFCALMLRFCHNVLVLLAFTFCSVIFVLCMPRLMEW